MSASQDHREYVKHSGTVLVAGSTIPHDAAACALVHIQQGEQTIEFVSIGANAGQQCAKAMAKLLELFGQTERDLHTCIAFQPVWYLLEMPDLRYPPQSRPMIKKLGIVWRVVKFVSAEVSLIPSSLQTP
jgi:stage V sporulation protein SpoVS